MNTSLDFIIKSSLHLLRLKIVPVRHKDEENVQKKSTYKKQVEELAQIKIALYFCTWCLRSLSTCQVQKRQMNFEPNLRRKRLRKSFSKTVLRISSSRFATIYSHFIVFCTNLRKVSMTRNRDNDVRFFTPSLDDVFSSPRLMG